MTLAAGLLQTAKSLAAAPRAGKPNQAKLRRAVSTAYYALFHQLMTLVANSLVGVSSQKRRSKAWAAIYRAIEHRGALRCCAAVAERNWGASRDLQRFAVAFRQLQEDRHAADYDPLRRFSLQEVKLLLESAAEAMQALDSVPRTEALEFSAYVLAGDKRR